MSESEKKRRQQYKALRKKRIFYQLICILAVTVLLVSSLFTFIAMNKTYYIEYTEHGDVDYSVYLNDNEFFDEEYLGKNNSYISVLVNHIKADFSYALDMSANKVGYSYSYSLDAVLDISNKDSGKTHFDKTYSLIPETTVSENSDKMSIAETVDIDYVQYNDLAKRFVTAYPSLQSDARCMLIVTMHVSVIGSCEEFENNSNNDYAVSLSIPLATETFEIETGSTLPSADSKIIACDRGAAKDVFKYISIILGIIDVLLIVFFVVFVYLTRNTDINYEIKIKRLLSSYKSFIQRISNEFNKEGYQVLLVKTFDELLEIRDTLQSPILMTENEDKTRSEFIIATNTKIIYMFEVKIDDYDLIYSLKQEDEAAESDMEKVQEETLCIPVAEEPIQLHTYHEEAVIVDSDVDEKSVEEAMATPDYLLSEIEFIDDWNEEESHRDDNGVEIIGVVWPEHAGKNKIYRYDPNGQKVNVGDYVLVPSTDVAKSKQIIRKATVAHENMKVSPDMLTHPLKKIVAVVKIVEDDLKPDEAKNKKKKAKEIK